MQITTKSGFTCDIDPNVLNNAPMLDALAEFESGNKLAYSTFCLHILGKETRARLYEHLMTKDGRVPLEDVDREMGEIMHALGTPAKN